MSEKMTKISPVEHSFKNKGTAKTQPLLLVPILLVQNFIESSSSLYPRIPQTSLG